MNRGAMLRHACRRDLAALTIAYAACVHQCGRRCTYICRSTCTTDNTSHTQAQEGREGWTLRHGTHERMRWLGTRAGTPGVLRTTPGGGAATAPAARTGARAAGRGRRDRAQPERVRRRSHVPAHAALLQRVRLWHTLHMSAAYRCPPTGAGAGEAHAEVATTSDGLDALVRPVQVLDFWALAEVHCTSFYPRAQWPFAPFLRLDRVVALQVRAHLLSSCLPRSPNVLMVCNGCAARNQQMGRG